MAIQDKADLTALYNALFPDNIGGDISAQDLRDYLEAILDSNKLQKIETIILSLSVENLPPADIDENHIHLMASLDQTINLPSLTNNFENISERFIHTSDDTKTYVPDGADNYVGPTVISDQGVMTIIGGQASWYAFFVPFRSRFDSYASAYFEESVIDTEINNVDQWEIIGTDPPSEQAFTAGPKTGDFIITGNEIEFQGVEDKTYAVDISGSMMKTAGATAVYEIAIAVNGVEQHPFNGVTLNNSDWIPATLTGIVTLSDTDVVTARIRSRSGTINCAVRDLSVKLTKVT